MPRSTRLRSRTALITMSCLLLAALGLALAWRWSPLHDYAEPRQLAHWLLQFRHTPWVLLVVLMLYLLASALLFPNTILNVATILGLGSMLGLPCALAGSMFAAAVFHGWGRAMASSACTNCSCRDSIVSAPGCRTAVSAASSC